jgi:hypothetical protein
MAFSLAAPVVASAQLGSLTEGFNDITTLSGAGWFTQNNSSPVGTTGWFQGNTGIFTAHAGAGNAYIAADFNNAANGPGLDTISNWLLTPVLDFSAGGVATFYTRTVSSVEFPDRLQVRYSNAGASTNVGTSATDVGDFSNLLLDINPTYSATGYPTAWTQFTVTIPAGANGRLAFRYFVEDGGPLGDNSDYIGIDTFQYTAIPEPGTLALLGVAGLGGVYQVTSIRRRRRHRRQK